MGKKSGNPAKYNMMSFAEFLRAVELPKPIKIGKGSGGDHTSPGELLAKGAVKPAKFHIGPVAIYKNIGRIK